MMSAAARQLPDGRLHLHHGPIDLIIFADSRQQAVIVTALRAAWMRFRTILEELVQELPLLRSGWSEASELPVGTTARRMCKSVTPYSRHEFITPMAAVAGAVAEEVLESMTRSADLDRAYVNNGGDIALHLSPGQSYRLTIADLNGNSLGEVEISADTPVRGIATSGRGGRSHSLGIADSVTVLAPTAVAADAAATLIANAADLPDHPTVERCLAEELNADTDLRGLSVVRACGRLTEDDISTALQSGVEVARTICCKGRVCAAALFLQGQSRFVCEENFRTLKDWWKLPDARH
ncbi:MAG: UPF0280 family protein [Rhodobacteraceae bacterium]|nr:UPF0280 family protein [Paracoccaceae bacterium]